MLAHSVTCHPGFHCLPKFRIKGFQYTKHCFVCLFCCFTSQLTAIVMARRSVHLTILSPGQTWTSSKPVLHAHTFACNWQQPFLNDSEEGRRMTAEIISRSISMKVWNWAGIKLATPGSAVRQASVARHVTDCARRPCTKGCIKV